MSDLGTIRFTPRSSGIKLFDRYRIIDEFLKDHFGKNEIAGSTKEEDLKQEIARLKKQLAEAVEVIKLSKQALHISKSTIGYEIYCDSLNKFLAKYRGENG